MEQAVTDVSRVVGERRACKHVGVPLSGFKRRQHSLLRLAEINVSLEETTPGITPIQKPLAAGSRHERRQEAAKLRRNQFRALTFAQRQAVLDAVHQPRFIDRSVPHIHATLLDEDVLKSGEFLTRSVPPLPAVYGPQSTRA